MAKNGFANLTDADRAALVTTATRLGVDPADLATVIAYETIGTMSPDIVGGAGNGYRGLIQFGKEERKAYGYRPGMSFADQVLGPVYNYLSDRRVKPGMGLVDLYSTVNAGSPGHPGRHDASGKSVRQHVAEMEKTYAPQARSWLDGIDVPGAVASISSMDREGIKSLQSDLASLGFYKGEIDGVAGPQTAQAMQGVSQYLGIPEQGQALPGLYHEMALNADPWHGNVVSPEVMAYQQDQLVGDMAGPNFMAEGVPAAAVSEDAQYAPVSGAPDTGTLTVADLNAAPPQTYASELNPAPSSAVAAIPSAPPPNGIAPKAGPFFDWSQRQQPLPAPPPAPHETALPSIMDAANQFTGLGPDMPTAGFDVPKEGKYGVDRAVSATMAGDPKRISAAWGDVKSRAMDSVGIGEGIGSLFGGASPEKRIRADIDGYMQALSPGVQNRMAGSYAFNPSLWAASPGSKDDVSKAKQAASNALSFGGALPWNEPEPSPASVFTARPSSNPFAGALSFAETPKSSPALAAVAAVGSGSGSSSGADRAPRYVLSDGASRAAAPWTSPSAASDIPRYGGGGGGVASAPWSSPSAASGYAASASAAPSKSYNAGAPVQSLSGVDTGKASAAPPPSPSSGYAAPAASATPAPSSVAGVTFGDAPGFMSAEDTKNAFGDAAGHLAAATTLVAPPASAPAAPRRVGGPAMGVTPRVAVKTFSAPIGGRYVQNPAPANPSMSQKLAAALGSMSAAQKAGYTTSRASDLAGLAAQGYTMPNYSAGSGGSTYAYNRNVGGTATDVHGNQVNVGTYYNSQGTPMTYQWSASGAP